jgi:hypothetical protein
MQDRDRGVFMLLNQEHVLLPIPAFRRHPLEGTTRFPSQNRVWNDSEKSVIVLAACG